MSDKPIVVSEITSILDLQEEDVKDRIAKRKIRIWSTCAMLMIFVFVNAVVVYLIWRAVQTDAALIQENLITSEGRMITEKVFMTLIGATFAQVAAFIMAMAKYIFSED